MEVQQVNSESEIQDGEIFDRVRYEYPYSFFSLHHEEEMPDGLDPLGKAIWMLNRHITMFQHCPHPPTEERRLARTQALRLTVQIRDYLKSLECDSGT